MKIIMAEVLKNQVLGEGNCLKKHIGIYFQGVGKMGEIEEGSAQS